MIVLIVDDSLLILKTVESQIKEMADIDEVILCSNSMQTLDIIKKNNVDIVIMDVMLPENNGLEILTGIRQEQTLNEVQVLMLTSGPEHLKEILELGANGFINKPFQPVELQMQVKAALLARKSLMQVNDMKRQLAAKDGELAKLNQLLKEIQFSMTQTEKMASIGEVAAGVAHEINNPLGFVKSNIDTLSSFLTNMSAMINTYRENVKTAHGKDKIKAHGECARKIAEAEKNYKIEYILSEIDPLFVDLKEGITRISRIVATLMGFVYSGLDGEHVPNSISSIIKEALLIIQNEYKYSIEIETQLCDDDEIICNKSQMEQVLINILMNAIHAINSRYHEDMGHIHIRTEHMDSSFQIRISDDGPGIPEHMLSRIFDPFFTTKDFGEGTGLGLSISHDIVVNKHGGQLRASNCESGAAFDIELPLRNLYRKELEPGEV